MNRVQALEVAGTGLGHKNAARAIIQNAFYCGFVNRFEDAKGKTVHVVLKSKKENKVEKNCVAR